MKSICVFCGSSTGARPSYALAARRLGKLLAERQITLVYGGAQIGLMGAVADATLANGGRAVGVLPAVLSSKEIAHPGLNELHVVASMHERKAMMAERAQAFLGLPGGFGTLEEIQEMVTWTQLGVHRKPCGVLNVDGYFDPLLQLVDRAAADGFLWPEHRSMLLVDTDPERLLQKLSDYRPPDIRKWIRQSET